MDYGAALAFLDAHINYEALAKDSGSAMRRLDRIRRLLELMGEPQRAYPVVHLTGTNGKGSTARIITGLLVAHGLSVGTYTSPHLERVNERLAWNDDPISDGAFAEVVEAVALSETLVEEQPSHFEVLTAAAFRWFADLAVDAAVVEVGLGGRLDATNTADGQVAVVTNVEVDHAEYLGPTRVAIAEEKAGIVKPGSTLVLGETDPMLTPIFRAAGAELVWERGVDFDCEDNRVAHGGRVLDLRTPGGTHDDLYLPLHGRHQGDNAALALAATEAFFGRPLGREAVEEAFAGVTNPGRMEVVGRRPLCILDAAHNPAGARALAESVAEAFGAGGGLLLVVGLNRGRDPADMLVALDAGRARLVVGCSPPWPRAHTADDIVAAAKELGVPASAAATVEDAVDLARAEAGPDDIVVVTGSFYVVGPARTWLLRR